MKETMSIREFLSKVNNDKTIDCVDIYNNITDEDGICYCPPVEFTKEGESHFQWTLDNIHVDYSFENCDDCAIFICDDDENNYSWQYKKKKAFELFYSLAGYCNSDDFDKWFVIK